MEENKNQPQYPLWPGSNFQRPSAFPPFGAYPQQFRMQYNANMNSQPRPNAFMMNNMYNMHNGMGRAAPLPPTPPELPKPVPAPDDIPLPEGPPPEKPPISNVAPPNRFQMMNPRQQNNFTPFPLKNKKKQKKKAFKQGGTWPHNGPNVHQPQMQHVPPPVPMQTPQPTLSASEPAQQATNLLSNLAQWPPKLK